MHSALKHKGRALYSYARAGVEVPISVWMALTAAEGTASINRLSRLPSRNAEFSVRPVRLPPGRARLDTSPLSIGAPTAGKTTGIFFWRKWKTPME